MIASVGKKFVFDWPPELIPEGRTEEFLVLQDAQERLARLNFLIDFAPFDEKHFTISERANG